jgi:hypothetical protein
MVFLTEENIDAIGERDLHGVFGKVEWGRIVEMRF